jgi:predicted nucleic acid-binding protein
VIVHLDTSALVDALTGPRHSLDVLIGHTDQGHRLAVSAIVLYEWLRGPRTHAELTAQADLFPSNAAVAFGPAEAEVAAKLYRAVPRARARQIDLAIAACALASNAALWTLNRDDFDDIPNLRLI